MRISIIKGCSKIKKKIIFDLYLLMIFTMELYPIKFSPIIKETIWGGDKISKLKSLNLDLNIGESWELSSVDDNLSVVVNGYLTGKTIRDLIDIFSADLVGKRCYDLFKNKFPLLIKFIDAKEDLSIQVHPDNAFAKKQGMNSGKTEMWYIVSCDNNSEISLGFNRKITKEQLREVVNNNSVIDVVNTFSVNPGNVFYVPSGRVHSIKKGCFLVEIQQSSDTTYRIYDYNRVDSHGNIRELHTDMAIEAVDYDGDEVLSVDYMKIEDSSSEIMTCDYFSVNIIDIKKGFVRDCSNIDSFLVLICIEGSCEIEDDKGNLTSINHGETVLIPAKTTHLTFTPNAKTTLLETYIK